MCILYNQRDATCTMFFIIISALHVSGGFSAHHQELMKLCAALGIVMFSCCLPLVWNTCISINLFSSSIPWRFQIHLGPTRYIMQDFQKFVQVTLLHNTHTPTSTMKERGFIKFVENFYLTLSQTFSRSVKCYLWYSTSWLVFVNHN
jgi:hypothetical protein